MKKSLVSNRTLQLCGVLVSLFFSIFLFNQKRTTFHSLEQIPNIAPFSNEEKLQMASGQKINTGLYIKDFTVFDVANNKFTIEALVWFEFDSKSVSREHIDQFSFVSGRFTKKSKGIEEKIGDKVFVKYDCRVQFEGTLDYQNFPVDDHRIYIGLTNEALDGRYYFLLTGEHYFNISDHISHGEWSILGKQTLNGVSRWLLTRSGQERRIKYPSVAFALDVRRTGLNKYAAIFLPLFILFFIGLFSLVIGMSHVTLKSIVFLPATCLSALIFYRLTIQGITPESAHLTLADQLYALFLTATFIIIVLQIYLYHFLKRDVSANPAELYEKLDYLRSLIYWIILFAVTTVTYFLFP